MSSHSSELEFHPVGSLSLSEYIFPGDRVVIVPDKRAAKQKRVLVALISRILQSGSLLENITLILTENELREQESAIREELGREISSGENLRILAHFPGNRREIAHLGASAKGEPIGFSREIVDADFVIPIGIPPRGKRNGYYGIHTALFPRFSDQETQMRFAQAESGKIPPSRKKTLIREVEEAANLLGIVFTIQRIGEQWFCGNPEEPEFQRLSENGK